MSLKIKASEHVAGGSVRLSDGAHDIEVQVRAKFADAIDGGKALNHIEVTVYQFDGSLPVHVVVP
jgi:hypothetical protein